ncbi:MAG: RNA ligase, partial [Gemmataceae bacterium]
MELRLDRLLDDLRDRQADVLAAIDADPLLLHRSAGGLVLANASKKLYTPAAQHQLYAKGVVYRRDPFRLVSLPLVKIYNVGERGVNAADLASVAAEPGVRLRFLRKMDGSLIQAFRDAGRLVFTTRGMIEGAAGGERDEDELPHFDYLAAARRIASALYPKVFDLPEGRTLLFELIHPDARKITSYGDRADLVLLAAFDRAGCRYLPYDELLTVAGDFGLAAVDMLTPPGDDLAAQIDGLLASLKGTDEEGSVVCLEHADRVVYRVKVKTPDYLQLMRLMAFCTYDRTVEMIDGRGITSWEQLEATLQEQGKNHVPEEVLVYYREHWERFAAYLADLERVRAWAVGQQDGIDALIGGRAGKEPGAYRRAYAGEATRRKHPALLFAALDGRLDTPRLRKLLPTPEDAAAVPGERHP